MLGDIFQTVASCDLQRRLRELPKDKKYVAYCRGPYCVYADRAVEILRATVPVTHWAWLAFGLLATYLAAGFGPGLLLVFTLGWLLLMVAGALSRQPAAVPIEPARVRP